MKTNVCFVRFKNRKGVIPMGYEAAAKEANEAFSKGIEMKTRKKKGKNYEKILSASFGSTDASQLLGWL